jgi:hypothetical protein
MTTKWFDRANALLSNLDISRVEVGEAIGQTAQSASMKLAGKRPTTVDEIAVIARLVHVSVAELVGDDEDFVRSLDEKELLHLFRLLSEGQRVSILNMMRSFIGSAHNDGG